MKKRLLIIALSAVCLLFVLISCKNSNNAEETSAVTQTEETSGTVIETVDETSAEEVTTEEETTIPSEVAINDIYPIPVEITKQDGVAVLPLAVEADSVHFDTLVRLGLTTDGKSGTKLTIETADLSSEFASGAEEGYILEVTSDEVKIKAQTERGVHYAVVTLGQLIQDGKYLPGVKVKDAPTVAIRGVIEGFYGEAWTKEFRLELMERMGDMKMNSYIYAPKDDLKHRAQWRELYAKKEIAELSELINAAKANGVKFIYAISPGNDINLTTLYSSDFKTLAKKCQQLYELGVRDFAILLDDIPVLDAAGHAKLLNDFNAKFIKTHEGCSELIAITPEYTDSFLTSYTDQIAPLIDKDINLMWTGPGVVYPTITCKSLEKINDKYGRNVFIWWNYPVNDVQVEHLYLDACRGLDTELYTSISGLVSNPMNQGEASLIPLFTTADYLWNPTHYDADKSLSAAVNIIDSNLHDELLLFADAVGASPMNNWTSTAILRDLIKQYKFGAYDAELNAKLIETCEKLATVGKIKESKNTAFVAEASAWIVKTEAYANMALAYFRMEKAYNEGDMNAVAQYIGDFAKWNGEIPTQKVLISQDVLDPFIAKLPAKVNQFVGITSKSAGVGNYSATTNFATYQGYPLENIYDGNANTYFWSAGGVQVGNYIQIDLGAMSVITEISFDNGCKLHPADAMVRGNLQYSSNGANWDTVSVIDSGTQTFGNLNIEARYVRIVATVAGTNWFTMSEFTVKSTPILDSRLKASDEFVPVLELARVCDGSALTVMTANASGKYIEFNVSDANEVTVIAPTVGEGSTYELLSADGKSLSTGTLQTNTKLDCKNVAKVKITLGNGEVSIAEIITK